MSWRSAPRIRPGVLSHADADALNQYFEELARFLGGFSAAPPLQTSQDRAGVRTLLNAQALTSAGDPINNFYVTNNYVKNLYLTQLLLEYTQFNLTLSTYTNFNVSGQGKIRFTAAGSCVIDGFTGLEDRQILFLLNTSAFNVGINAGFNVATPWGVGYVIYPGREIVLQYDGIAGVLRFATPTFCAGTTGTAFTSGCDKLIPGANLVSVDNGDGSQTWNAAGGGALTSGQFILGADKTLTSSYAAVPTVTVTLPVAGTYKLICQVTGTFVTFSPPSGGTGNVQAKLYDATGLQDVPGSVVMVANLFVANGSGNNNSQPGTATIDVQYAVTGATVIDLYAQYTSGANNGSAINHNGNGMTVLSYIKIG